MARAGSAAPGDRRVVSPLGLTVQRAALHGRSTGTRRPGSISERSPPIEVKAAERAIGGPARRAAAQAARTCTARAGMHGTRDLLGAAPFGTRKQPRLPVLLRSGAAGRRAVARLQRPRKPEICASVAVHRSSGPARRERISAFRAAGPQPLTAYPCNSLRTFGH